MTTPKADGLRMPADGDSHVQCWMAWPNSRERWGARLDAAAEAYGTVAKAIAAFEPVTVVTGPARAADVSLRCGRGVSVLSAETVDSHLRDYGPTFVVDSGAGVPGGVAGIDWRFDGSEGRAERFDKDAAIARALLDTLKMRRYTSELALEGGAIQADGEGTLLAIEPGLLARNPDLDRAQIEARLGTALGAEK